MTDDPDSPTHEMPDRLRTLPPSCCACYLALVLEGPLTQSAVVTVTGLSDRTARYALIRLRNHGCISERPHMADARKTVYERVEGEQ